MPTIAPGLRPPPEGVWWLGVAFPVVTTAAAYAAFCLPATLEPWAQLGPQLATTLTV